MTYKVLLENRETYRRRTVTVDAPSTTAAAAIALKQNPGHYTVSITSC